MKKWTGFVLSVLAIGFIISQVSGLQNVASALVWVVALTSLAQLFILLVCAVEKSEKSFSTISDIHKAAQESAPLKQTRRLVMCVVLAYFGMFFTLAAFLVALTAQALTKAGAEKEMALRRADV